MVSAPEENTCGHPARRPAAVAFFCDIPPAFSPFMTHVKDGADTNRVLWRHQSRTIYRVIPPLRGLCPPEPRLFFGPVKKILK